MKPETVSPTSLAMSYLSERGIREPQAIIHGITWCQADKIPEQFGISGKGYPEGTSAILLPHCDLHGQETGFVSARMVVPEKHRGWPKPKSKEPINTMRRAHFPRTNKFQDTLYITESWIKAVKLSEAGKFAVGVNGCNGWGGGKNAEMLEDLWRFPWNSIQRLVIVWDSDIRTNPNVKASACRLFHKLKFIREADIEIMLLMVPDKADGSKQGVDDWIVSGEADLETLTTFADAEIDVHDSPFYELNSKVCYVAGSNVFVDLEGCDVMHERHFHTRYATVKVENKDGNPIPATRPWIGWVDRCERGKIVSRPGAERMLPDAVNVWQPSDVTPTDGDVSVHLEFLRRAIPSDVERQYLQQWIGHAVQKQDVKMNVALVFFSPEEGTGKTMTANAIGRMFGTHNVANMTIALLKEGFNSAYATKQLLIINENNRSNESRAILEKLKTFITEREVMVRQMHTNPYSVENYCNVIMTMNHSDALPMSAHDRRFMIIQFAPVLAQDPAYGELVWDWHDQHVSDLLGYYMEMDLEGFNPFKAPPMNEAKRALTMAAADRYTHAVVDLCSDPAEFFSSIGWREDLRYFTWAGLAKQLWHDDAGFVNKKTLDSDTKSLGAAFAAQASHYGYDPAKCKVQKKIAGKTIWLVDLRPGEDEDTKARQRDIENPRGDKMGN